MKGSVINSMILGSNYFCCLCFKTVADTATHVEDKVIVMKQDRIYNEIFMVDILSKILGPEIEDQLSIFNAVCNHCSSAAIRSYKFLTTCQDNSQKVNNIIDSLTKGTEICSTNANGSKAGFVSINTENFEYNGYNSTKIHMQRPAIHQMFLSLHCKDKYKNKSAMKIDSNRYGNSDPKTNKKILQLKLVKLNPYILKNKKAIVCPGCEKFFSTRSVMFKHYRKNIGMDRHESDFPFKVRDPKKHFSNSFQCTECVDVFSSEVELIQHLNDKHILKCKPSSRYNIQDPFEMYMYKNQAKTKHVPTILKHSLKKSIKKELLMTEEQ